MLYRFLHLWVPPFLRLYWRLEVVGSPVPPGPAIVVSNHESLLDPFVLGAAIDRPLRYLAKRELWDSRLLGKAAESLGAIPVSRQRGDVGAVEAASRAMDAGDTLIIFPQGTTLGPSDRPWQRGAARLALTTGAPLVPVAIVGARKGLGPGMRLPRPARVRVVVGEPIRVAPGPVTIPAARELTARVRAEVEALGGASPQYDTR